MPIWRKPIEEPSRRPRLGRLAVAAALIAAGAGAWWMRGPAPNLPPTRVLVVALPGADFGLISRFLSEGKLPNLAQLARQGCFHPLVPTTPLVSPSVWASLATGMGPERHGIYDFPVEHAIHPYLPAPFAGWSLVSPPEFLWDFIPAQGPEVRSRRLGRAFWKLAADARVPTTLLWFPGTFPAPQTDRPFLSWVAGPETPDALGTYGLPTYLTTVDDEVADTTGLFSGQVVHLSREGIWWTGTVPGPLSPTVRQRVAAVDRQLAQLAFERGGTRSELRRTVLEERRARLEQSLPLRLPIRLRRVGQHAEAHFGGAETTVPLGQWSPLVSVQMPVNGFLSLYGVCRFFLVAMQPEVRLYMTPIDLDLVRSREPLAYPAGFAATVVKAGGVQKTRGQPSEWAGLAAGRLPESAFLSDVEDTFRSRTAAVEATLSRRWGLFCCALPDAAEVERMFWPSTKSPAAGAHQDAVEKTYCRLDGWIGEIVKRHVDERTVLMLVSAHGWTGFDKAVDLNRWLVEAGYMRLSTEKPPPTTLRDYYAAHEGLAGSAYDVIDWSKTEAYTAGVGSINLNLAGREPRGIVASGAERRQLLRRLQSDLSALRDPDTGEPVVARVVIPAEAVSAATETALDAPDLLVVFRPGYRMAWPSRLGQVGETWLAPNREHWNGDCEGMDPDSLPGVFFCNRTLSAPPRAIDLAPTVLSLLNLPVPEAMQGKSLLGPAAPSSTP